MSKTKPLHFLVIFAVIFIWTCIVIGFSTSLGDRPLRIYDWGPPAFSGILTLIYMLIQRKQSRN